MQEELLSSPILFYISLAPSFKMESLSPKARCNLNASRGNALGHSLNSLLPQGMTQPNMGRSVRRFKLDKIGFLGDVSKFFNSSYLDSSSYKYNMVCIRNKLGEVEDFVCARLFYGLASSTSLAEMGMKLICEQAIKNCSLCGGTKDNDNMDTDDCEGLAHVFQDLINNLYVDDVFLGASSTKHAKELMEYISITPKPTHTTLSQDLFIMASSSEGPLLNRRMSSQCRMERK